MKQLTLNPTLFKVNDRLAAVLSSVCTAIFVSLIIYLVLLERMGDYLTLALLSKMFPSRELTFVFVMLTSLSFAGIPAMICYNYDMLPSVLAADGLLKITASLFLAVITNIWVLYIVVAVCAVYFLSAGLRVISTRRQTETSKTDTIDE